MKKIIVITILFLSPVVVFAAESWKIFENKNTLSIEGECLEKNVRIELYAAGKGEPLYSSNAFCKNGKFKFSDNLLQWKNLKDGKYEVVLNGNVDDVKNVEIQRPVVQNIPEVKKTEKKEIVPEVISPQNKFLAAFVSLQRAMLDMRTWLGETEYPSIVKSSIGFGLDGVDLAIGKISDLILSGESIDAESNTPEAEAVVIESQKIEENISDKIESNDVSEVIVDENQVIAQDKKEIVVDESIETVQ